MELVVLIIHLILALALIGVVLMQRSEGGALGIGGGGGGGGGMSGFLTGKATANLLTRATAIIAALFIATSMTLAIMSGGRSGPSSVVTGEGGARPSSSSSQSGGSQSGGSQSGGTQKPSAPIVPTR